jgi:D-alanyl-D-alanine carboxypeptidase/D-alanyl-D-alanine-endopeptidase (penicillin-binding protein 4)
VIVEAKPTVNGRASKVTLTPSTGIVRLVNRSKTVPKGYKNTLKIQREIVTNNILITGNAPIGSAGGKSGCGIKSSCLPFSVFKKSLASKGISLCHLLKYYEENMNARILSKKSMPLKS